MVLRIAVALILASVPLVAQEEIVERPFAPAAEEAEGRRLLDLAELNEKVAGERGFVRVDPTTGDFLRGDGKPIRFWAVNSTVGREQPWTKRPRWQGPEPDLDRHARFLARRGVNMVRLHAFLNPELGKEPGAALDQARASEIDWIRRAVAAYREEGIYVTISPYWANEMRYGPEENAHALLFFDETLKAAWKSWMRQLLEPKNPHTGIPLAKDPAIAILQIQNEDSLLFWTINALAGEPRRELGRRFAAWLAREHGSVEKAVARWQGDRLPGDDPARGLLDFHNVWEMTQDRDGGRQRRLADQLRFWTELMRDFDLEMATFLRKELGCQQLVNAGNWKTASPARLEDAERWSYAALDVLATNHYFGGRHEGKSTGWAIVAGDRYDDPSALLEPWRLPFLLRQPRGKPMIVTETGWVLPGSHGAEAPFLAAVYQSLTGVDASYFFSTRTEGFCEPESANGYLPSQAKWTFATPEVLGGFPAAAYAFRQGLIARGEPVVVEERTLDDLWNRVPAAVVEHQGFDPNRDAARRAHEEGTISSLAFLAGPIEVVHGRSGARKVSPKLARLIDEEGRRVRSITGEIEMDFGNGVCTVDAPRAQGVAAFFRADGRRSFELSCLAVEAPSGEATVWAVALDGKDLRQSRRVLVQVGVPSRPKGWREEESGDGLKRILDFGGPPWMLRFPKVRVTLRNAFLRRGHRLDESFRDRGGVALERDASRGRVGFQWPQSASYLILEG